MPTLSATQCEQIIANFFQAIRARFEQALEGTGEEDNALIVPDTKSLDDDTLFIGSDRILHVDQIRRIALSLTGDSTMWGIRNGKRSFSAKNDTELGLLTLYMGYERFVTAEMCLLLLCDIVTGMPIRGGETSIAALVNLAVVEPHYHPERELAIWLTVAHQLAISKDREDLHEILPELSSDFDPLYKELPATGRAAAKLRPGQKREETLPAYEVRLLQAIRPDLSETIEKLTTDEECSRFFASMEDIVRAYIHTQLYGRIAEAANARDGGYALPHPHDDDEVGLQAS